MRSLVKENAEKHFKDSLDTDLYEFVGYAKEKDKEPSWKILNKNARLRRLKMKGLALQYKIAQRLVFSKVKPRIGLNRARICVSGAAPINKEILEFFEVLPELTGLKKVNLKNFREDGCTKYVSKALMEELHAALQQRGGKLYIFQDTFQCRCLTVIMRPCRCWGNVSRVSV